MSLYKVEHKRGVEWFKAPIPFTWHRCWAQTTGYDILGMRDVERCACGAIRVDADNPYRQAEWCERNSRKKSEAQK